MTSHDAEYDSDYEESAISWIEPKLLHHPLYATIEGFAAEGFTCYCPRYRNDEAEAVSITGLLAILTRGRRVTVADQTLEERTLALCAELIRPKAKVCPHYRTVPQGVRTVSCEIGRASCRESGWRC